MSFRSLGREIPLKEGGYGNPLQYSCLETSMGRGAWWATIHGVSQSRTRLKQLNSSSSSSSSLHKTDRVGNGIPLQYSCLENPMDRGAWWATIHGVAKTERHHFPFSLS